MTSYGERCLRTCKLSYHVTITVSGFISVLVLITSLISLSIGIGEAPGIARKKKQTNKQKFVSETISVKNPVLQVFNEGELEQIENKQPP